jgi:anti-anti-sigma factor
MISIQWATHDDVCRCTLAGELDLATESRVRRALFQAIAEQPKVLIIDLEGVTFLDSTGLRALLTARNRAANTGTRIVLSRMSRAVERTLEIANLRAFFEFDGADAGAQSS